MTTMTKPPLAQPLLTARRVTEVHEEALYSLNEHDRGYNDLRAATAARVLFECNLRKVVGEIDEDRALAPALRPCNHLLYRDGLCVGCGAQWSAVPRDLVSVK